MEQRFMYLCRPRSVRRPSDRRGFSFTEILFAVMILGIGFIMVAAIFPVAIQQTALTGDETVAAAIAREGTDAMTSINNSALLPPTVSNPPSVTAVAGQRVIGQVWSLHDDRMVNWTPSAPTGTVLQRDVTWNAISGNLILPMDRRYAWVGMYKRDGTWNGPTPNQISPDPYAQVIIIGVQCRNRSAYDPTVDLDRAPNVTPAQPATLEPAVMTASLEASDPTTAGAPVMTFPTNIPTSDGHTDRLAPGAFVVISDDNLINYGPPTSPYRQYAGQFNGHVYRLGNFRADKSTADLLVYELAPGYDAFPDPGISTNVLEVKNAQVMVVGKAFANPANPYNGKSLLQFEGGIQDVAVYVTYIRVN